MILLPFLHCLIHLSLGIVGFEIFSFVVRLATTGKTDSNLRQASLIQKESQADNRQTLILQGALQLRKLLAIEQEFAVTLGDMVVAGTPRILGDIHASYPQLTLLEVAVAIDHRGLAQADRFYLGTHQNNACDILLEYLVVESRSLVADIYLFVICHYHTISHKDNKKLLVF